MLITLMQSSPIQKRSPTNNPKKIKRLGAFAPSRFSHSAGHLFLYYLLAPRALVALGALQITGSSSVHRVKCLRVGGNDFVTAIFAFVSAYADLKLQSVEAGYQKECAECKYRNEHPRTLGYKKRDERKTSEQSNETHRHDHPH